MAGVAVGVRIVIKQDVVPIAGACMAVAALTRPMSIRALVAGVTTLSNAGVVKGDIVPICGVVAVGA